MKQVDSEEDLKTDSDGMSEEYWQIADKFTNQ